MFPFFLIIMTGRGKGGKVKGKTKFRSSRAGLQFPSDESTGIEYFYLCSFDEVRKRFFADIGKKIYSYW